MSDITLTASVRQNLLSLQSTAELLATTQNRLATGKKVNTALDNPTNFFTAAGLDSRASDINSLLDGIGNGVQVLQAANTGITSLQKLVDSAKSIANQVLQLPVGYTSKSSIQTAVIPGATTTNLLGTPSYTSNPATPGTAKLDTLTVPAAMTGATRLSGGTTAVSGLPVALTTSDFFTVNGKTISFSTSGTGNQALANGNYVIDLATPATATISNLLGVIDTLAGNTGTGAVASTVTAGGALQLNTGVNADLDLGGDTATLNKLGLSTALNSATRTATYPLGGQTLTIPALNASSSAINITFGTDTDNGQVQTLAQLNKALATNKLQAILDPSGFLTISTSNEAASEKIGTLGGTAATDPTKAFFGLSSSTPVQDQASQISRSNLVAQYNNIIDQITTTSQDASFNGVNLLGGDQLKLVFNETGRSTLSITGTTLTPEGLGLKGLASGIDFLDNVSANNLLDRLNVASSILRSQASALGSNLSIVQIRQDFAKNLINVLQTGSSNLTLADQNEEAANSQALSTRQSIAVSALALANQSQQSVLKLLQ